MHLDYQQVIARIFLLGVCVACSGPAFSAGLSAWTKLTISAEEAVEKKDLPKAEHFYLAALDECRKNPDSTLRQVTTLLRLTQVLREQSKNAEAEKAARKAIALEKGVPEGPLEWRLLWGLSIVCRDEHKYQESADLIEYLLKTRGQIMGTRGGDYWLQLLNLAEDRQMLRQFDLADRTIYQALSFVQNRQDLGQIKGTLVRLGLIQRAEHKYKEAEATLLKAISIQKTDDNAIFLAHTYFDLAETTKQTGDNKKQEEYLKQTVHYAQIGMPKTDWMRGHYERVLAAFENHTEAEP